MGTIPLASTSLVEDIDHSAYSDTVKNSSFTLQVNSDSSDLLSVTLMANKANDKALWTSDITQVHYHP